MAANRLAKVVRLTALPVQRNQPEGEARAGVQHDRAGRHAGHRRGLRRKLRARHPAGAVERGDAASYAPAELGVEQAAAAESRRGHAVHVAARLNDGPDVLEHLEELRARRSVGLRVDAGGRDVVRGPGHGCLSSSSEFSSVSWPARRIPADRAGKARSAMRGHRASGLTNAVGRRAPPFGSRPGARPRRRGPQPYSPIRFSARSWRIEHLGATQAVTLVKTPSYASTPRTTASTTASAGLPAPS